jgi:predicted HNH restriction endonuclease
MKFAIITENDKSEWKDETGSKYHFPTRYLKIIEPGTKIIYYKGRLTDAAYKPYRLSSDPHYFGIGVIGAISRDDTSGKNDYFASIESYKKFARSVSFKIDGKPIETVPINKKQNYWRDGVRAIDKNIYERIINIAGIDKLEKIYNDLNIESKSLESEFFEGGLLMRFVNTYERDPKARQQAINLHGYTCQGCGFNFQESYGEWGEGYIQVHHLKPLSTSKEEYKVNPQTDLSVLCANCHSMVHRRRDKLISLEELKSIISYNNKK